MHFHIRKAELTDAKAIAQVHVKGWQQSYKDIISHDYLANISYEERLKQRIHLLEQGNHHTIYLVATVEDKVIGFCDAGSSFEISLAKEKFTRFTFLINLNNKALGQPCGMKLAII